MRYVSTRVRFNHESHNWLHLYLARGKDRAGNKYGDPSKSYDELRQYREKHNKGGH